MFLLLGFVVENLLAMRARRQYFAPVKLICMVHPVFEGVKNDPWAGGAFISRLGAVPTFDLTVDFYQVALETDQVLLVKPFPTRHTLFHSYHMLSPDMPLHVLVICQLVITLQTLPHFGLRVLNVMPQGFVLAQFIQAWEFILAKRAFQA